MGKDRVLHPTQPSRSGGVKQVKSGIIEGPTASPDNFTPYNREGGKAQGMKGGK